MTCFCSKTTVRNWIEASGLGLEALELRPAASEAGQVRNWFARCTRGEA